MVKERKRTFGDAAVAEPVSEEKKWPYEEPNEAAPSTPPPDPTKKEKKQRAPRAPRPTNGLREVLMNDFMAAVGEVEVADNSKLAAALDNVELRIKVLRALLG